MQFDGIIKEALKMRGVAYAPYSRFKVGAALITKDGRAYAGCNIENAAYTPCCCAERTAFFKAVSEGEREFSAIAIAGGAEGAKELPVCPPCGVCRQVMREFCDPETFQVVLAQSETRYQVYTLQELLPLGFGPENVR